MSEHALILLSGGLDSAVNLAIAADQGRARLALTIDYGHRAAAREIRASKRLCDYYRVDHETISLPWMGWLGGSALTAGGSKVPELTPSQLDDPNMTRESARSVWVPNRNGVFINVAAALAEKCGLSSVIVGFNREEAATFPDNSEEFLIAARQALRFSTANHVIAECFTLQMDKRQIVAAARALSRPFPFDLLWSCYLGEEMACGKCESCRRLERAMAREAPNASLGGLS